MGYFDNYCVVEADTNRYYNEMDRLESFDEGLQEYVRDKYIDTLLWKGEVVLSEFRLNGRWHTTKLFMREAIDAYIEEVCDGDNSDYMLLSAAIIKNKQDDESDDRMQALRDYAEKAVEWYFMEQDDGYQQYSEEYEKYLEDDSF